MVMRSVRVAACAVRVGGKHWESEYFFKKVPRAVLEYYILKYRHLGPCYYKPYYNRKYARLTMNSMYSCTAVPCTHIGRHRPNGALPQPNVETAVASSQ